MADTIDECYTEDQIGKARELIDMLRLEKTKRGYYPTSWGIKTEEGLVNTILGIMYGRG